MPWRPSFDDSRDPRLVPFRERAGHLTHDNGGQGWVYVRPWLIARSLGGHLWWRRWGPQEETTAGFVLLQEVDSPDDWVDEPEDVAREISDWSAGRFRWRGIEYSVSWAGADASRRIRDDVFGLGEPE